MTIALEIASDGFLCPEEQPLQHQLNELFGFQLNVPVGFADELRPALDTNTVRCIQRVPHRPSWLLQERHISLLGRSIGFTSVAVDTSENAIRPA